MPDDDNADNVEIDLSKKDPKTPAEQRSLILLKLNRGQLGMLAGFGSVVITVLGVGFKLNSQWVRMQATLEQEQKDIIQEKVDEDKQIDQLRDGQRTLWSYISSHTTYHP